MKIKLLLAALAVAGLGVSAAVAAPAHAKGKPDTTGPNCKPKITVVLKGTLGGAPAGNTLKVNVKSGNRWGRAYVKATQPLSISVNADTKIRRQGKAELKDLADKDRVLVQARVCKEDLKDNKTPALTATKVIAHPEKAQNDQNNQKDEKDENDDD
jgi:hypothetical protein